MEYSESAPTLSPFSSLDLYAQLQDMMLIILSYVTTGNFHRGPMGAMGCFLVSKVFLKIFISFKIGTYSQVSVSVLSAVLDSMSPLLC